MDINSTRPALTPPPPLSSHPSSLPLPLSSCSYFQWNHISRAFYTNTVHREDNSHIKAMSSDGVLWSPDVLFAARSAWKSGAETPAVSAEKLIMDRDVETTQ